MKKLLINNPFNLETIKEEELIPENTLLQYIESAQNIVDNKKKWLSKVARIEILEKFKTILIKNKLSLVEQATSEGGKPYKDSLVEVERGINGVGVAIDEIKALSGREVPMNITPSSQGRIAYTHHRPRGMVVAISAFNHPFNLIIHQVIPGIAAGCPVIIKPAVTTPLSCKSIVHYLYEAGLEKDYCRTVICDNEVAEKLVTHPHNSFLSFIGSSKVGWFLRSKLPPGAKCALEHGGAAPTIVDETADLASCLPLLIKGGFYHAGQVCVSVQRIFVHESIINSFLEGFIKLSSELKVGDPLKKDTDVGPLILPREVDRVETWVKEAISMGAKAVLGGKKISDTVFAPTILVNTPEEATIAKKEVFGPVVLVQSFQNFQDAIHRANNVEYAFQASVFTQKLDSALWASQELEGLATMVNDHSAFRTDWMPFGGYKQSGLGLGGIGESIKDMSLEKMTVIQSNHLKR